MNDTRNSQLTTPTAIVPQLNWTNALKTLQIQPDTAVYDLRVPRELLTRHKEIETLSKQKSFPIRFLGYNTCPERTCIYQGETSDWALMNLKSDPYFYSNGNRLVVPEKVSKQINLIVNEGIEFNAVYVAHEIPKSALKQGECVPLELIVPPHSPETMRRIHKRAEEAEKFWKKLGAIAKTTAASFTTALATSDPVLFGANVNPTWKINNRLIAMWYFITRWDW